MKINTLVFQNKKWNILNLQEDNNEQIDIILIFGNIATLQKYNHYTLLKADYKNADIVACSTAGNILDIDVDRYEAVATAIKFEKGYHKIFTARLDKKNIAHNVHTLFNTIDEKNLKHLFILSPGLLNGSDIMEGIKKNDTVSWSISGGLAGDNYQFKKTYILANKQLGEDLFVVIGLYGEDLHVSIGCNTGWDTFGATRIITKSKENIVYEIDNKPAIELYERYLADNINDMPNSALRFPLSIKENADDRNGIILVVMGINEDKSLVYAGNIKEGSLVRLMKTNVTNLIDGAGLSAKEIIHYNQKTSLSLTISCSARKTVLKQFAQEEIETIQEILPQNTHIVGFYSYGEIAPFSNDLTNTLLHNQTITITTIYEE